MMLIFLGGIFFLVAGWYIIGCPGVTVCPFFRKEKAPPKKVYMTFVGPWDSADDWSDVIAAFREYKRNERNGYLDVNIGYERINDTLNYEEIVRERRSEDKGPNIFMVFHNWIPRYKEKILPVPESIMNLKTFKETYAKATVEDLTQEDGTVFALPFYIDTLALYYNERMFLNESFLEPPESWRDFENYAEMLTSYKKNDSGQVAKDDDGNPVIDVAGAAFGGGSNVNRSQDIIMLLVMQNNYDEKNIVSFNTPGAANGIKFYIDFTDPKSRFYTWNKNEMFSIDAFAQRKAAMMINYSEQIKNITRKTGGALDYKIAPLPQLNDDKKVNYASYWVPVVASKSECGVEAGVRVNCFNLAWEFLSFASQKANTVMYLDRTNRAAANLAIAKEESLKGDARSVFAGQVFTARSWRNENDAVANDKLLEMIDYLVADKMNRGQMGTAMAIPKRFISEINR